MPPITHTQSPITTGASVIGLKYKDGVILAADTMISYGNMLKFPGISRIEKVGQNTIVGASGEYSDFQELQKMLGEVELNDWVAQDGSNVGPREIGSYLGRVLYNRRSRINPLWNQVVIAGRKKGQTVLEYADLQGTWFEEDFVATGFGGHLAIPILRAKCGAPQPGDEPLWKSMSEAEAKKNFD